MKSLKSLTPLPLAVDLEGPYPSTVAGNETSAAGSEPPAFAAAQVVLPAGQHGVTPGAAVHRVLLGVSDPCLSRPPLRTCSKRGVAPMESRVPRAHALHEDAVARWLSRRESTQQQLRELLVRSLQETLASANAVRKPRHTRKGEGSLRGRRPLPERDPALPEGVRERIRASRLAGLTLRASSTSSIARASRPPHGGALARGDGEEGARLASSERDSRRPCRFRDLPGRAATQHLGGSYPCAASGCGP